MGFGFGFAEANIGSDHVSVVPITVFVAVLCLCLVFGHLLEENRWVNESSTAIFIGSLSGTIILLISKGKSSHILRFNEELFFIYLLPPIIFNAGSQVKKKQFFQNFLTIMGFGVVGVFMSSLIITAGSWWLFPKFGFAGLSPQDYLAIGAIFSSTDTVCTLQFEILMSLDLMAGQLLESWWISFTCSPQALPLEFMMGFQQHTFSKACTLRLYLCFGWRHSSVREIALMILMAYLSYMLAELLHLSGILTVFFSGILISHYAWHNVADSSRITTRHAFATMSFIAETFIFLDVGMDVLDIEKWKISKLSFQTSLGIYCITMFLILFGHVAFVFPLSALSNYMNRNAGRSSSITFKHQVIIWWAGLMRGAVSIALAFKQFTYSGVTMDPLNATMVTTTVVIVLFSTIVFGFLTKPLVHYLLPQHPSHRNIVHQDEPGSPQEDQTLPLIFLEESVSTNMIHAKDSLSMLIERPVYTIHTYWRTFDDKYMRPIFGGPRSSACPC